MPVLAFWFLSPKHILVDPIVINLRQITVNEKILLWEAAKKKVPPLVDGPLRPYPPPPRAYWPSELFFVGFFFSLKIAKNGF